MIRKRSQHQEQASLLWVCYPLLGGSRRVLSSSTLENASAGVGGVSWQCALQENEAPPWSMRCEHLPSNQSGRVKGCSDLALVSC